MLNIILAICCASSFVAVGLDIAGFDMTKIFLASGIVAMGVFIIKVAKEKKMRKEKKVKETEQACQPKAEFRGETLDRMLAPGGFIRKDGETDWDFVQRVALDLFRKTRNFKVVATIIFGKSSTRLDDNQRWLYSDTYKKITRCPDNSRGRKKAEFAVRNFIHGFPPGDPAAY